MISIYTIVFDCKWILHARIKDIVYLKIHYIKHKKSSPQAQINTYILDTILKFPCLTIFPPNNNSIQKAHIGM
jgi:hypothetical protein